MQNRRTFLRLSALSALALSVPAYLRSAIRLSSVKTGGGHFTGTNEATIISTWPHGLPANRKAWEILSGGGSMLDAVEQGINVPELDPEVTSVGYGGYPDRDGVVTLDACIMDEKGNCGSVAFLEGIKMPISVARLVMEKTPHIMLAGSGALEFAIANGFKGENLLTDKARNKWQEWLKSSGYTPGKTSPENHDTIGLLALDDKGNLSAGCSTSGLAWKYHGRVGDSPIIGAGMFCDNDVGAAAATGKGEAVIKIAGSHLVVELMRQGKSPQEACEDAVLKIAQKQPDYQDFQVAFIALDKKGRYGAFSLQEGFEYALTIAGKHTMNKSGFFIKTKKK